MEHTAVKQVLSGLGYSQIGTGLGFLASPGCAFFIWHVTPDQVHFFHWSEPYVALTAARCWLDKAFSMSRPVAVWTVQISFFWWRSSSWTVFVPHPTFRLDSYSWKNRRIFKFSWIPWVLILLAMHWITRLYSVLKTILKFKALRIWRTNKSLVWNPLGISKCLRQASERSSRQNTNVSTGTSFAMIYPSLWGIPHWYSKVPCVSR